MGNNNNEQKHPARIPARVLSLQMRLIWIQV